MFKKLEFPDLKSDMVLQIKTNKKGSWRNASRGKSFIYIKILKTKKELCSSPYGCDCQYAYTGFIEYQELNSNEIKSSFINYIIYGKILSQEEIEKINEESKINYLFKDFKNYTINDLVLGFYNINIDSNGLILNQEKGKLLHKSFKEIQIISININKNSINYRFLDSDKINEYYFNYSNFYLQLVKTRKEMFSEFEEIPISKLQCNKKYKVITTPTKHIPLTLKSENEFCKFTEIEINNINDKSFNYKFTEKEFIDNWGKQSHIAFLTNVYVQPLELTSINEEAVAINEPIETLFKNGNHEWRLNGTLHREDGPAREYANGILFWYFDGELHRLNGPAVEMFNNSNEWYQNGLRHREDGPAVENKNKSIQEWWQNNKRHRLDGPAVIRGEYIEYWENGVNVTSTKLLNKTKEVESLKQRIIDLENNLHNLSVKNVLKDLKNNLEISNIQIEDKDIKQITKHTCKVCERF